MKKSTDGLCRFCSSRELETLFHWQSKCTKFNDALTKVHNDIWSAVSQAICSHLPEGWEFFKETPVKDVFSSVQNHPDHARRQPDGIFSRSSDVKHVLVDFTRGYGWNTATLVLQENIKKESYAALMDTLRVHHTAEFFPLVCGYTGAIAVSTWTSLMDCLELDPRAQEKVLLTATRAICIGFSTMVDIRHGCLNATDPSSHPGVNRHR
jgi:hypothetical protein